ncbi:FtsQ-type POTRA domain-containing protein, partial [bacterium]|nr:FtsQ-type POTRA domain-containing protein [bacterium]
PRWYERERPRRHIGSMLVVASLLLGLTGVLLVPSARARVSGLFTSQFSIRQIILVGKDGFDMSEVTSCCLSNMGRSLITSSSDEILERVGRLPSVKGVSLRKQLPSTMIIYLQPREPRFKTMREDKLCGISEDGYILSAQDRGQFESLPALSGLTYSHTDNITRVRNEYFSDIVRLCNMFNDASSESRLGPEAVIEAVDKLEVRVRPTKAGPVLIFSLDDCDRQMKKYRKAIPTLAEYTSKSKIVDLRFRGQIVLSNKN